MTSNDPFLSFFKEFSVSKRNQEVVCREPLIVLCLTARRTCWSGQSNRTSRDKRDPLSLGSLP